MRIIRLFVGSLILSLLAVSLFGLPTPSHKASAHAVQDNSSSVQDCIKLCTANNSGPAQTAAAPVRKEEQKRTATQMPAEPFYVSFLVSETPLRKAETPANVSGLFRPPDLIKLYANYRN